MLRFFDRYLGIPMVSAFALVPKRTFDPATARRIGLMKTVAIGDIVLLAGIIKDVRRRYPNATIVLITGEDNRVAGQLMLAKGDEQVVISPHRPMASLRAVRDARLDVLVDFGAWPRFDAMLTAFSGARFRVGFRTPGEARHFAYDHTVEHSNRVHEIDNFRALVVPIGVQSTTAPRIAPPGVLRPNGIPRRPYAVFHPWPGGLTQEMKEWPNERWAELAKRLVPHGWQIVLSGSPADREKSRGLATAIGSAGITVVDVAGTFSIAELADVLAASEMVVSVNTGVMHLAAGVGARVVGLQGPTSSARWAPLGANARAVDSTLPGCGYLNLGWEYEGRRLDCMSGVEVGAVVKAIDELLLSS